MKYKNISLVFPAYNEEGNIEYCINAALEVAEGLFETFEVIVVDDGSADRTGGIADAFAAKDQRVKVFHHKPNQGKAKALKTGFANAKYDIVFFSDADLQQDLKELKNLLPAIEDYDIVCGFRINRCGPFMRIVVSWCFNFLVRTIFRVRVRDVNCPFKLFRRSVFDRVTINSHGYAVDTEILAKARKEGFTMTEVGVRHYPRKTGRSTVRLSHIIAMFKEFANIWIEMYLGAKT